MENTIYKQIDIESLITNKKVGESVRDISLIYDDEFFISENKLYIENKYSLDMELINVNDLIADYFYMVEENLNSNYKLKDVDYHKELEKHYNTLADNMGL